MGAASSTSSSPTNQPHTPTFFPNQVLQIFSVLLRDSITALTRNLLRIRRSRSASNFTPGSPHIGIAEGALGSDSMGNVLRLSRNCRVSKESISQAPHKEPQSSSCREIDGKISEDGAALASSSDVSHITQLEDAGKMLNSLSLSSDNNSKSERLESDIDLQETLLESYESLRLDNKHEESDLFVPLNEDDEEAVAIAFANRNRSKVLVVHETSNIEITGGLLQCLRPRGWLNDEVINLYLELLKERENREPQKFLKCHFFNTFFYKKLRGGGNGYDHKFVRRWTTQRKLGYSLIDCDKIFVPIHKEVHWCLAVINNKDQNFQYLDSLGGKDSDVLKLLATYFMDEVKDKSGKDIDVSSWECEYVNNLPTQKNGFDCGVFMIKYIDFYSRGMRLDFSQEDIPYFRLRTAKEILQLRAD